MTQSPLPHPLSKLSSFLSLSLTFSLAPLTAPSSSIAHPQWQAAQGAGSPSPKLILPAGPAHQHRPSHFWGLFQCVCVGGWLGSGSHPSGPGDVKRALLSARPCSGPRTQGPKSVKGQHLAETQHILPGCPLDAGPGHSLPCPGYSLWELGCLTTALPEGSVDVRPMAQDKRQKGS